MAGTVRGAGIAGKAAIDQGLPIPWEPVVIIANIRFHTIQTSLFPWCRLYHQGRFSYHKPLKRNIPNPGG